MLGNVIQRYGPTMILIVIAVVLWGLMAEVDRRMGDLQSFDRQRFDSLEGRIGNLEQAQADMRERLARIENEIQRLPAIESKLDEVIRAVAELQGQGIGGPNESR